MFIRTRFRLKQTKNKSQKKKETDPSRKKSRDETKKRTPRGISDRIGSSRPPAPGSPGRTAPRGRSPPPAARSAAPMGGVRGGGEFEGKKTPKKTAGKDRSLKNVAKMWSVPRSRSKHTPQNVPERSQNTQKTSSRQASHAGPAGWACR